MTITISENDSSSTYRLFTVNLDGTDINVTVTSTSSVVKRWISATTFFYRSFIGRLIVGLGVQWTPGYIDTPADTLTLCVGTRCLVYQLSNSPYVPMLLRRFLLDSGNTFVGFWNHSDRFKLKISEHRLEMLRDPLDVRVYAETDDGESLDRASVEEIVEECLGYRGVIMRREISMSDWDDENLSYGQILQATLDAHCAFEIGKMYDLWRYT